MLDVGCGVGGPAREIAKFTRCNVVGLNNNDYQVERATWYAQREGLTDQVVLVSRECLPEWLALAECAEVKALRPAVLVQVSCEIVVMPGQCGVFLPSRLADLGRLEGGWFLVPVLEVLVDGQFLGIPVLAHQIQEGVSVLAGRTVQCLLERSIALKVLWFEGNRSHFQLVKIEWYVGIRIFGQSVNGFLAGKCSKNLINYLFSI